MKPCPFCGDSPFSNGTQAWCWGGFGSESHGLICMPIAAWETRASPPLRWVEGAPPAPADEAFTVSKLTGEVSRTTVPVFREATVAVTKTERQRVMAADFGEEARKLADLMDFGHGGD